MLELRQKLATLEAQFTPIHTHLAGLQLHNTAHSLLVIFQELKTTVLSLLEKAEEGPLASLLPPEWKDQVLDLLLQIERTTKVTDKNVDTILSNWGDLKASVGKLITLAEEAVTVEPDDPRAEQIASEMAQLKATIDPIVATPAPSQAQTTAASQAAGQQAGAPQGATGTTAPQQPAVGATGAPPAASTLAGGTTKAVSG